LIKAGERAAKTSNASAMDGVAVALPALRRAEKLGQRAAAAGFDWPDAVGPRAKIDEELAELAVECAAGDLPKAADELGDLLFAVVNLARHLDIDPEQALAGANRKFEGRFRTMEQAIDSTGQAMQDLDLEALETCWEEAKSSNS